MEEKETLFFTQALQVFMKYGIKSVTMDDMARHLGISKKTIYNHVKDKNDLVKKALILQCDGEQCVIQGICDKGLNAIDEMFEIGQFVSSLLKDLHPSIHYDLEKYHSDAFQEMTKEHQMNIYTCILGNLKKGIKEGLYRSDVNADVIAKIYMMKMDIVFNAELFPPSEISFDSVYAIMFRYHILGVASSEGAEYLNKRLKKVNPTAL